MPKKTKPHPWDEWFARLEWPEDVLELWAVKDFVCSEVSMQRQLRREADERGIRLTVTLVRGAGARPGLRVSRIFRHGVYPWGTWLDGQRHVLTAGTDFPKTTSPAHFLRQVHGAAQRRGQTVTGEVRGDSVAIRATSSQPTAHLDRLELALRRMPPGKHQLAAVRAHLAQELPDPPDGRALGDLLRGLGWKYHRSSTARYWVAPDSNTLES